MQPERPVLVVTGTSKGLGQGIATYYLDKNYIVFGCSRAPATIDCADYHHAQLDVADEIAVRGWIRSVKNVAKKIDVLVCNAGAAPANLLLTMTSGSVLDEVLRTNIAGTFHVCREVAKVMMMQRQGRIITTSTMAVGLHEEGTSAYSASKSAVVEMTKILAKELAPVGITCNVIAPSMIMTEAVEILGEEIINRALSKLTIKRQLSVEEVCNVITFFCRPESGCITGQVIHLGLVC